MNLAYIGLGSNLGDRAALIKCSIKMLNEERQVNVTKISTMIATKPVGGPPQPDYLNAAVEIETSLLPDELLHTLQGIELELGRERVTKWGPRTIDLDILFYGDVVVNSEHLTIPHHLLHLRRFVLEPLVEIAQDLRHPHFDKTILELFEDLDNK